MYRIRRDFEWHLYRVPHRENHTKSHSLQNRSSLFHSTYSEQKNNIIIQSEKNECSSFWCLDNIISNLLWSLGKMFPPWFTLRTLALFQPPMITPCDRVWVTIRDYRANTWGSWKVKLIYHTLVDQWVGHAWSIDCKRRRLGLIYQPRTRWCVSKHFNPIIPTSMTNYWEWNEIRFRSINTRRNTVDPTWKTNSKETCI